MTLSPSSTEYSCSRALKPHPVRGQGQFHEYDLGFVHIDVKHPPKLRTADGDIRKRYLYVAIDRCSRYVHLAVFDAENAANACAFLRVVKAAFPFWITHVLTDRGSCFTAEAFERLCTQSGILHRRTRAYSPQTNGMVERFNGRIASEVLGITVASHADLETLLMAFNHAYNRRRQRVLDGLPPIGKFQQRLSAMPELASSTSPLSSDTQLMNKVDDILFYANDVSQADN